MIRVIDTQLELIAVRPLVVVASSDRGLHSSTSQLNLSRFRHKIHPEHPMILLNTP